MGDDRSAIGSETTSFSVSGMRNGSPVVVRWDRGHVSGDPPTTDLISVEVELVAAGWNDPLVLRTAGVSASAGADPLSDPLSALALICRVIDRVSDVSVSS